jgi:hypothetical protein
VIAHSPMVQGFGELPHRIVIRDLGNALVVHMEVNEPDKNPWYTHGDYCTKSNKLGSPRESEDEAMSRAWPIFEERSRRTLNLPHTTRETSEL